MMHYQNPSGVAQSAKATHEKQTIDSIITITILGAGAAV